MARHRVTLMRLAMLFGMLASTPVGAQSTAAPSATIPVAPPTSGTAVGPPQLRDFNLNGTVTQRPTAAPTTAAPTTADPTTAATTRRPRSVPAPRARATPRRAAPTSAPLEPVPVTPQPTLAVPTPGAAPDTISAPTAIDTPPTPVPAPTVREDAAQPLLWWPWLAALAAVALGGALWWHRRRSKVVDRYPDDRADLGAIVALPDPAPAPALPAPAPPAPAPAPAPALPASLGLGIVASGLKPRIEFELVPLQAETDSAEGAALTFDLIVINRGSAPARDVLIEAQLINAGAELDAEVGRFFAQAPGSGERLPMIAPMARVSLRTRLAVAGANLSPLVVEGRKLLVPLVALNARYRWSGGEATDSMSFLVGRSAAEGAKMAPFRLDLGARSWSGLAARLHSSGLA